MVNTEQDIPHDGSYESAEEEMVSEDSPSSEGSYFILIMPLIFKIML